MRGDDFGLVVERADLSDGTLQHVGRLVFRLRENDFRGVANLIGVDFGKFLEIRIDGPRRKHHDRRKQRDALVLNATDAAEDAAELAHARGLDDQIFGIHRSRNGKDGIDEGIFLRATHAPFHKLQYLKRAAPGEGAAVEIVVAVFVFKNHGLLLRAANQFLDERGFSSTQKTRYDEDFHIILG